jgi:excisionase family DNA binding protein
MSVQNLLLELQSKGVRFRPEGEGFRVLAHQGLITPDLRDELTERKPEILLLHLTVEELAEMLQLSPRTIHDMVSARRIPFHKVGSNTRFLLSEIIEWTAGRWNDESRFQVVR